MQLRKHEIGVPIQKETKLFFDVAQHCANFAFPLRYILYCKFCNFLLRNKAHTYAYYNYLFRVIKHSQLDPLGITKVRFAG